MTILRQVDYGVENKLPRAHVPPLERLKLFLEDKVPPERLVPAARSESEVYPSREFLYFSAFCLQRLKLFLEDKMPRELGREGGECGEMNALALSRAKEGREDELAG